MNAITCDAAKPDSAPASRADQACLYNFPQQIFAHFVPLCLQFQTANEPNELTTLVKGMAATVVASNILTQGPMVIMELMTQGDLASYLRHLGDSGEGVVSQAQIYLWATQIADGMAYLAMRKYVHRYGSDTKEMELLCLTFLYFTTILFI
ncbi:unnamed protein product [Protopolystoma xenopodis]|uniref:Serine-threonine/tyrosine-protein kinase catalytic domain-containing protein n=1 Tax=Protopolystoma xenopodis TaxID=117903 RepID=A0A448WTU2_9PLAT|nr:unnamed protein product [Protopolystoma xenopodis]